MITIAACAAAPATEGGWRGLVRLLRLPVLRHAALLQPHLPAPRAQRAAARRQPHREVLLRGARHRAEVPRAAGGRGRGRAGPQLQLRAEPARCWPGCGGHAGVAAEAGGQPAPPQHGQPPPGGLGVRGLAPAEDGAAPPPGHLQGQAEVRAQVSPVASDLHQ